MSTPLRPSQILRGKRLVVIGGTGFLGKVWVAMLLHDFPDIGHIHLVVRQKGEQTPEERFWAEIASSPVFDPQRELHPGAAIETFLRDKITPVAGDVVAPKLGFSDELCDELRGKVDVIVNVAGVVDFNPPLDEALNVNAFGVRNLIDLAEDLGAAVLHTSTTYVAGYRTGFIEEVDPRDVPFPRAEGAPGERLVSKPKGVPVDRKLDRAHWDPQNEISESMDLIEHTRHRSEDAFRQSLFLDEAKRNLTKRGEPCRGHVLEDELNKVKRKFTHDRLVEAGIERAQYWGWPNIYTYTKSIGEQVLAASGVPYTIVRPAVVESSNQFPMVGWNEGINTSALYIYILLQGHMQLPTDANVNLDIIPVDMVAAGMTVALVELLEGTHKPVYQLGCADVNPCSVGRFVELIGLYKRKKFQDGGDEGNPLVNILKAHFEAISLTRKQYETHGAHGLAKAARGAATVLDLVGVGPAAQFVKPAVRAIRKAADQEDKLGDLIDLFLPFVAECDYVFSCANMRAALERMPEDERQAFYWEPEAIDWREWMFEVHVPAIERYTNPEFKRRMQRELKPLRAYDHLIDLLDEMAERHQHSVALRYLEDDGFSRVTFNEWREASATCAARLAELGVGKGDRVLLSGSNRPAWPMAYFGILRAGAVAVPVDPKLTAPQLENVVSSSGAKVAIWGNEVDDEGGRITRERVPDLLVLDLDEIVTDDRGAIPPEVAIDGRDLASIIYTSGTTGEPKGVMLTHENFARMLAAITPLFTLSPRDGALSVLPLHHTFEFSCGLLLPMSRGASVSYIGEVTADRLSEGLEHGRVSAMVGVPALWQMLERKVVKEARAGGAVQAQAFDWALELNRMLGKATGINAGRLFFGTVHDKLGGRVRYLISGGGALPKSTAKVFAGLGLNLSEGYGLTEAAPVLTVAKASPRTRSGQVGKPLPGVELKIAEPGNDGVGEILARGPNVMKGYFGNDEATKEVIDEEGWLHTGDLGKLDKRGQLVLSGRSKEVIISTSGENVYPDDVEDMLGDVPHIDELAIVGVRRGDTEVVACIAVPSGDDERAVSHPRAMRSLKDAISNLPRTCQPAIVHLYDAALPKTATRKVKRTEVKKILERLASAAALPRGEHGEQTAAFTTVQHAVAAISSRKPAEITQQMSLAADLGFDSLMSMELTVALEAQVGHSLAPEQLNRVETVADLVDVLGSRRAIVPAAIEKTEKEAIDLPPVVASAARNLLAKAQMGFYGRVMKPEVFGRAFIPHNRNTIVVSNHVSHLDMGFAKYALGSYGQDVVGLAAADYFFEGRWRRTYFEQLTNLQAFERKTNLRQALRKAGDTIRGGRTVLIFPEGTRSKDGAVHEFKSTLGHLALSNGVDILPIFLGGTYESWPKGQRVPMRRDIHAHIGPPLLIDELRRLTDGMKFGAACRAVANLARQAVIALQRGSVLDLADFATLEEALGEEKVHPLVALFRELESKYVVGKISKPITFYFSLGAEEEAKWTAQLEPDGCKIRLGKPASSADCVLKTSPDIFTKMVRDKYMPSATEVMSGQVKSNDVSLLATFQEAFDL